MTTTSAVKAGDVVLLQTHRDGATSSAKPQTTDWQALAEQTAERLRICEESLRETQKSADELRARAMKYKARLDNAQGELTRRQVTLVDQAKELETLRARVARMDIIKQRVWDLRQSLLDGPIWELFADL